MAVSQYATFVGLGKETTPGTAVPATLFVPVTDAKPEDVRNYVSDEGMRGSVVDSYNEIPTQGWGTYEFDGPVYMDTIGVPLKALFGAEDLSGSGPYVHRFGVLNNGTFQPPTYTISDFNGLNTRQFPFAMCSQVELTYSADALLSYTANWSTFPSAVGTKPTQAFSAKSATAAYKSVMTIGGVQATDVESATFTMSRDVNPIIGITGSQNPIAIYGGAVSVTGQFTAIYSANAETAYLQAMIAGTSTTVELSLTNGTDILDLKCSNALLTKAPISRGKDYVELTVDFTGVANTTDANTSGGGYCPASATLSNSTSTAY